MNDFLKQQTTGQYVAKRTFETQKYTQNSELFISEMKIAQKYKEKIVDFVQLYI